MAPDSGPLEGITEVQIHPAGDGCLKQRGAVHFPLEVFENGAVSVLHAAEVVKNSLDGVTPLLRPTLIDLRNWSTLSPSVTLISLVGLWYFIYFMILFSERE